MAAVSCKFALQTHDSNFISFARSRFPCTSWFRHAGPCPWMPHSKIKELEFGIKQFVWYLRAFTLGKGAL